jgi:putative DNA methylase
MSDRPFEQLELILGATEKIAKEKKPARKKVLSTEAGPPNLAMPIKVSVPDFSDPKRPKTCLEVDFPLVPINALSALEGNAGKPIYQMSKWWARRRSCVFRAMLIAAGMEAPTRKNPDGTAMLDENGVPVPDETEAAKAVWDVYYANHQKAENFKHLKVLDCFMGGGTTLVEGSRLGFQVSGVDLNPVAWFVVKNELACTDPEEVKRLFDQIEAEVKPQIQPFYVTDCPRGHKGKWYKRDVTIDGVTRDQEMPAEFDPITLPPDERKGYRYEGPEIIYTFWAKHGPCVRPECNHRTPIFRSPVIAEKKLGVKYIELTCKSCKTVFHAELGRARMAPAAERVVLDNEHPFTEMSQPFAKGLLEYAKGDKAEKFERVASLLESVENEPGLHCPSCGVFAGQWVRDVLKMHNRASRTAEIDKKHLKIQPGGNGAKPVYCYLLIHSDWLKGSPAKVNGSVLGGYTDGTPEENAAWYAERLKNLRLVEVRGRIKLAEDSAALPENGNGQAVKEVVSGPSDTRKAGDPEDRKSYGVPHYITLSDGSSLNTQYSTVPKQSHFTCGGCGQMQDFRVAVQTSGRLSPVMPYAFQCYSAARDEESHPYGGRYFTAPSPEDMQRLVAAEREWSGRKDADLAPYWPREEIGHSYMTHQANFALPAQGYTHWWKMFNPRQLLVHASLMQAGSRHAPDEELHAQALGAIQQYLRNQNMFCIWDQGYDKLAPFFSNSNYAPKNLVIENSVFGKLGRGNWTSTIEKIEEGLNWIQRPWEVALPEYAERTGDSRLILDDSVQPGANVWCGSSTDLSRSVNQQNDLVITDPPFGDNIFYADLSNFFYVWLRVALMGRYPDLFGPVSTPVSQEAIARRDMLEEEANDRYRTLLTACWEEAHRVLKDAGVLAFTFHHSEDTQWGIVLRSLFDAGFILEQTFPIASDEMKGEGGQFGAKGTEYDIIHVCRKRLENPAPVSWARMRQWVKAELQRLRGLLAAYKARELSAADIRVILRGKALEFYSRHYGQVFTAEDAPLPLQEALLGINQLLNEDSGEPGQRPPTQAHPVSQEFLRLFGARPVLTRDELSKQLRGTTLVQKQFEELGWVVEHNKVVSCVPIQDRFEELRQRPRREMKTDIDQAHFLIGAALPNSGVTIEEELGRNTWAVRRSVEAVLQWYARTGLSPEMRRAAEIAAQLLRTSLDQRRAQLVQEQGFLFDDLEEVA